MTISGLTNRRVLIIEDDVTLRSLLARHLKQLGCLVDQASSSAEARQALNSGHNYEVVVADIHLPDGDALQVAHESHETKPDLPFIFITGDHDSELFETALQERPAGYLMKPFELIELDALVVHTIGEKSPGPTRQFKSDAQRDVTQALRSTGAVKVMLRKDTSTRRAPMHHFYLKIAAVAAIILLIAFGLGYLLHDTDPKPPVITNQVNVPRQQAPVYVPVAPASERNR